MSDIWIDDLIQALRLVVGEGQVNLHEPTFSGNEWTYVKECIDTGWVSSAGKFVNRLERDLADYTGAAHAVAMVNGTAGLHIALQVSDVRPGDEVLVPALTFVGTANAICHAGAVPHFVDSDTTTLGISVPSLADYLADIARPGQDGLINRLTGRRLAAVVPMHTFGHPMDIDALTELAAKHGIAVIEDAAESLGSWVGRCHTGTFGRCGVLSFNGNKIMTTGGGGAIITNDSDLARHAKHLTTTAKLPHPWAFVHDEVAYNYRMPNINAALGCAQLEQLPQFLDSKRGLVRRYQEATANISGVSLFQERPNTRANYWLQTLLLDENQAHRKNEILAATNAAGIMTRPVWDLLPTLEMYRKSPKMPLSVAENLARRIINIPSSPSLTRDQK